MGEISISQESELLKYALEHDMIDLSYIQEQISMNKRKEILKKHPYSVWHGSDGNWYTYVPDPNKKRGFALRKRSSEEKINDCIVEFWEGEEKNNADKKFIEVYSMWRNLKDKMVSENTASKYDSDRKRFFDDNEFSQKEMKTITSYDIEVFMYENIKKYKLQNETCRKLFGYVTNTFCLAGQLGIIDRNPAQFLKAKNFYHNCYQKNTSSEGKLVSQKDMQALQLQFQKDHEEHPEYIPTYAVEFATLTGMRVGEIAALRWDHIFEDHIFIEFSEKYNASRKKFWIDRPKNKRTREFPMTKEIRELLDKVKSVEIEYGYFCEWVFADENGRIHAPVISSCSKNKCRQAQVNEGGEQGIRIYRRTLNSKLRCNGVPVTIASSMLGHSEQVNKTYYTFDISSNKEKAEILSRINKDTLGVLP